MLTIYHTNDLHNSLSAEKAARLKSLKQEAPDSLLLDAGDAIWAGNIYVRPGGEPALRLMSWAGYDAMTLGNREFHFVQSGLKLKLGWAGFPVLCANIRPTRPHNALPVIPHISREIAGLRVAILGLTVPMITEKMLVKKISAYVFDNPVEIALRLVPELRKEHDLIVALTHIGITVDRKLAEEVPGIDLIIGGHSHTKLEAPEVVGITPIVQAGWWGHYVGRTQVKKTGNEVRVSGSIIEL